MVGRDGKCSCFDKMSSSDSKRGFWLLLFFTMVKKLHRLFRRSIPTEEIIAHSTYVTLGRKDLCNAARTLGKVKSTKRRILSCIFFLNLFLNILLLLLLPTSNHFSSQKVGAGWSPTLLIPASKVILAALITLN